MEKDTEQAKYCESCKERKPVSVFYDYMAIRDTAHCRYCMNKKKRDKLHRNPYLRLKEIIRVSEYRKNIKEKNNENPPKHENDAEKRCRTCKTVKPLSQFYKDMSRFDGKTLSCRTCLNFWQKSYKKDKEKDE